MPRVVTATVSARCEAACRPAASFAVGSDTSLHAPPTVRLLLVVRLIAWCMRPVLPPLRAVVLGHCATRAARKKGTRRMHVQKHAKPVHAPARCVRRFFANLGP